MLSILIPTYNYNSFPLVEALHAQAEKLAIPFEIIVADDASPDSSFLDLNQKITQLSNCQLLINKTNLGRTATRNRLAKTAKYEWLLFLDTDVNPATNSFISLYVNKIQKDIDVIYGGVKYSELKPDHKQLLRWVYGNKRETKSVQERLKRPFEIISQNLCITKEFFKLSNVNEMNRYGLDVFFSYKLRKLKARMVHIDNPVIHLGLEDTKVFIEKSLISVETSYLLEKNNELDTSSRPLMKSYQKLKNLKINGLFIVTINSIEKLIISNLNSTKPSLFLFDIYRLYHYSKLKRNA